MQSMQSWLSAAGKQVLGTKEQKPADESAQEGAYENKVLDDEDEKENDGEKPTNEPQSHGDEQSLLHEDKPAGGSGLLTGDFFGQLKDRTLSGLTAAGSATRSVAEGAKTFVHTIEHNSMLGEFAGEQRKWMDEVRARKSSKAAVPPWVGYNEETLMKKQILALSLDTRNFLRDPPAGADFSYDGENMAAVALATLDEDPNLRKMRFQLVPKKVSEERFWRNYFYRVSLIKQSAQLSSLAVQSQSQSSTTADQPTQQVKQTESASGSSVRPAAVTTGALSDDGDQVEQEQQEPQVTEEELDQVRQQLGLAKGNEKDPVEPDHTVEQEILSDLNEFELVSDDDKDKEKEKDLEKEIEDLLESEIESDKQGSKGK